MIREWLTHPLLKGRRPDDVERTLLNRRIIAENPFLRRIYAEWYTAIAAELPDGEEPVLEIGSGAGFLREFIPGLITSEPFPCPTADAVVDAAALPFPDAGLRAVVMTDVLHHLPQPRAFFAEAARCVRAGGAVVMVEPWVTAWSRFVYGRFHPEPFLADAREWECPTDGPLAGANSALPWIMFRRDRGVFEQEFPQWHIAKVRSMMPFRYPLSGGVSMRSLMPGWSFGVWRLVEGACTPLMGCLAMFALIVLRRAPEGGIGS